MKESKITIGEEIFLTIIKNHQDWRGASCNQATLYEDDENIQIKAWLNGHLNLDTGVLNKKENTITYEITSPRYNIRPRKDDNILFQFNHSKLQGKMVGYSSKATGALCIEVGNYIYEIKERNIIAINDVLIASGAKMINESSKN